jgi:dolichyl-diphosphooligosaccharide--protein glycosyltransferase
MARIGSSVFPFICPKDPLCTKFGFYSQNQPTPSMAASLLYKLHSNGLSPGVTADPTLWQEVYRSKYGLVRIYKVLNVSDKSKKFSADPANRKCDAPGSWYCPGQYPPLLIKAMGAELPKSHRNLNYDDPNHYVEEIDH